MQALKMFLGNNNSSSSNSGYGNSSNQQSSQGGTQGQLIGLAMAEASKLFDHQASQGNVQAGANKESVVAKAGEMALKMYLKGQVGSGGGGPSGLLSMASKFF